MTGRGIAAVLVLAAALGIGAGTGIAASQQAQSPPVTAERVAKLEDRVQALEKGLEFQRGATISVAALTETARTTLQHTKDMFEHTQWTLGVLGTVGGAFLAVVGVFGYRRISKSIEDAHEELSGRIEVIERDARQAVTDARGAATEMRTAERTYRDQVTKLEGLARELEGIRAHIQADALGHRRSAEAFAYIALTELEPDEGRRAAYLAQAIVQFDSFFDSLKNPASGKPSPQVLAHVHALKGYALKRLDRIQEALLEIRAAIDADPSVPDLFYNAACYAALLGEERQALAYIGTAIKMRPSLRGDALGDGDLRRYWDDIGRL